MGARETTKLFSVKIAGKNYLMQIINGVQFIDGMTIDKFIDTLPISDVVDFARVGYEIVKDPTKSPSKILDEMHQSKNN